MSTSLPQQRPAPRCIATCPARRERAKNWAFALKYRYANPSAAPMPGFREIHSPNREFQNQKLPRGGRMHSAATLSSQPHRACGACGATGSTVCHHQRFIVPDGYPLPDEYSVAVCRRCGFVYADPAATQSDYDRFYCEWSKYDDSATATATRVSPHPPAPLPTTAPHAP